MKKIDIAKHLIAEQSTIREALKKINLLPNGHALVLFVLNEKQQIIGSISDGDIRRALLKGLSLDEKVLPAINKNYKFINEKVSAKEIKKYREEDFKIAPIVDEDKKLVDLIDFKQRKCILPLDAIIMAGGKGTRLHPYTQDIPKPLLELEKKPIICHNIDRLAYFGVRNFYVSVNHLKEQIKKTLDEYYQDSDISIEYIEENKPLGTLGSVGLVDDYKNDDLLVINADILTNIDFEDFYMSYKNSDDDMCVAAFSVNIDIPYAVLETKENKILSFLEKPSYTYHSNAGIYLFKKKFVKIIPQEQQYDAIDLMNYLIEKKHNLSHFPITGYWLDIGNLQNYRKAKEDIKFLKLFN